MDRRQRKTREAIFRAFTELLGKNNYANITVGEIIRRLDEMCGQTFAGPTINTQVQILVSRGLVAQGTKIHQSFTYSPLVSREDFQTREVKRFCEMTFNGAPSALVAAMLRNGLSEDEIAKIKEMINP